MATNAVRQAAFRQRRDARIAQMQEALRNKGDGADLARLKGELAQDRQTLELAQVAIRMLKAQNKRLARGESILAPAQAGEPRETAALPDLDLDRANDEGRALYENAPADVKTWIKSFANLPRKDAKDAYQLFLCLTAINALPIGKAKPRKRAVT
jgi:hypothetical protein